MADKVPSPLIPTGIKDEGIPEKIYISLADVARIKKSAQADVWVTDKIEESVKSDIEFILKSVADKRVQDAIKPIVEVYEKYKDLDMDNDIYLHGSVVGEKLWQAIKATKEERD